MSRYGQLSLFIGFLSLLAFVLGRLFLGSLGLLWIPLGVSVAAFMATVVLDFKIFKDFFTLRTTRHGMNMGVLVLLVVAFLFILNFLSVRYYHSWDFSEGQVNTLADQSVKVVSGLEENVVFNFFYQDGVEGMAETQRQFRQIIRKYQDVSEYIRLEFVEVNERPDLAEKFEVKSGGPEVVVVYQGRESRIRKVSEEEFTNALITLTRTESRRILFVSGHGEKSIEAEKDPLGLSQLKKLLETKRYESSEVSLLEEPEIPKDVTVVAVVGPQRAFLEPELAVLENHLKEGGTLLLALDPEAGADYAGFLQKMGVEVNPKYVVQLTPFGRLQTTAARNFDPSHKATQAFARVAQADFLLPMSLKVADSLPDGIKATQVLTSSGRGTLAFDDKSFKGTPQAGPFGFMIAVSGKWPGSESGKEFEALIFADSDFLSNQLLFRTSNSDIALGSFAYLSRDEDLVSIAPKEVKSTPVNLSGGELRYFLILFGVPLPIVFLLLALVIWFRRRFA